MSTQVSTRIDRARWWALTNQPFYGALAMRLPDVMRPDIETAHTNGREIAWNPTFVESLTDEELRFVLLHETLHCAHQHMWRLPADERGNIAGDHAINLTLKDIPGIKMPEGGLADPQYAGMAEEDILGSLPKPKPKDGDGKDGKGDKGGEDGKGQSQGGASQSDQGKPGQGKPQQGQPGQGQPGQDQGQPSQGGKPDPCGSFGSPGADPSGDGAGDAEAQAQASKELQDAWDGAVIQAAQAAQAMGVGSIPGDLQRILERIRHQSIDWRGEMEDFVKSAMSQRNDWTRSSKRHSWQSVIYPRKRANEVGKIIFVRDTSGSVSDKQLSVYSALITECLAETGCHGVVIDADTKIKDEIELEPGDVCPLHAKGGGGTDFRPAFDRADELAEDEVIAGLVYITDLCGPAPDDSEIPTLWLSTTAKEGPFGRTVRVEA